MDLMAEDANLRSTTKRSTSMDLPLSSDRVLGSKQTGLSKVIFPPVANLNRVFSSSGMKSPNRFPSKLQPIMWSSRRSLRSTSSISAAIQQVESHTIAKSASEASFSNANALCVSNCVIQAACCATQNTGAHKQCNNMHTRKIRCSSVANMPLEDSEIMTLSTLQKK